MDNARRKQLIESMKKINKNFKDSFADFAENTEKASLISCGIKQIDDFIGGGFKKGAFHVLWGGESVGKSTLVLQAIANAQKEGEICCYLDMERSFDRERAVTLGVNLEELVFISKCRTAEEALEVIRTLSKDKVVDMIVLDSIHSLSPKGEQENKGKERGLDEKEMAELARTLSKFFRVVAPDIYNAKIACVLVGQARMSLGSFIVRAGLSGGKALHHWVNENIFMRRGQKSDAPVQKYKMYFLDPEKNVRYKTCSEEIGFDAVLKLSKTKSSKSAKEGSEIHVPFLYEKGFVDSIEDDDIPVKIDAKNEEERKIIEDYLKEKKIEDARKAGVYIGTEEPKQTFTQDDFVDDINYAKEAIKQIKKEKSKKKKRGRPKKENK